MLQRVHCLPIGCSDELLAFASPEVIRLVTALEGCCHPKRERLLARLALDPRDEELAKARYDVLELLTLSFGPAEARRRLQ